MRITFKEPAHEDLVWVQIKPEPAATIKKIVNRDVANEAILAVAQVARTQFHVPVRCQDQFNGNDMVYTAFLTDEDVDILKVVYERT